MINILNITTDTIISLRLLDKTLISISPKKSKTVNSRNVNILNLPSGLIVKTEKVETKKVEPKEPKEIVKEEPMEVKKEDKESEIKSETPVVKKPRGRGRKPKIEDKED